MDSDSSDKPTKKRKTTTQEWRRNKKIEIESNNDLLCKLKEDSEDLKLCIIAQKASNTGGSIDVEFVKSIKKSFAEKKEYKDIVNWTKEMEEDIKLQANRPAKYEGSQKKLIELYEAYIKVLDKDLKRCPRITTGYIC